jgi:ring-1,2-phenylacetyl-CoA epoxidase subunit PaaA
MNRKEREMAAKVHGPNDTMSPEYREMLIRLMKKQMATEILTADIYGNSIKLAPSMRDKEQIAGFAHEEAGHGQLVAKLLGELGEDPEAVLKERVNLAVFSEDKDVAEEFSDWVEVVVFNFLGDRAGTYQLTEYDDTSYVPWARAMKRVLEEEDIHVATGEQQIAALCQDSATRQRAQALVDKWFPRLILVFGNPKNPWDRYCIDVGLKTKGAGQIQYNFVRSLIEPMKRAGLRFPDLTGTRLELTPEVKGLLV